MHWLTPAEARVIGALLASVAGGEGDRANEAGVPRTTYQMVRRRVLQSGWLTERFIPAPSAVGAESIRIRIAQPYAEHLAAVAGEWRADPTVVLLWVTPETVVAVSYELEPASGTKARVPGVEGGPSTWFRRTWEVSANPEHGELPVYFDFEGSWVRRIGTAAPISYPQSLPLGPTKGAPPRTRDLRELLVRPFAGRLDDGSVLRFSSNYLPRRQRRLLEDTWVAHRLFPSLGEIPPFQGGRDERVILLTGLFSQGESVESLLYRLSQEAQVSPFLAACDDTRAILAMLSPAPSSVTHRADSVLSVLQKSLHHIEFFREPLETLFPAIDHRYDRLVTSDSESSSV